MSKIPKKPDKPANPNSVMSRYPDTVRKPAVAQEQDTSSSGIIWKMLVAIILMIAAGVGSIYVLRGFSSGKSSASPMLGEDGLIMAMIDDYGVQDLKEWLEYYEGRMVMGQTREQSKTMADRWIKLGAKNVLAFKVSIMNMSVVIELPDEKDKRKACFDWYLQRWISAGNKSGGDVGQRYILLIMSP